MPVSTSTPSPPGPSFFSPLGAARLWVTLLWTLGLACGLAAWDWAERRIEAESAPRRIVLLPSIPPETSERADILTKLAAEPGVAGAEWIAPADLSRRIAQLFPQSEWRDLFPPDEPWLTWVLEVRPAAPLDAPGLAADFAARRRQEGSWRMVLWDGAAMAERIHARGALRAFAGFFGALLALAGAAALACLPLPRRGRGALAAWSALLGTVAPAAVWGAALLGGADADARGLALAAGAGFILATTIAPVLRKPERSS